MQVDQSGENRLARPAHATVVAYLALFVALGGSATALKGKNSVTSDDIRKGHVRTSDIAKKAVKRAKIAKRAVNGRRLALRSVSTSHLIPASVTNFVLASDAVTSEKILDLGVDKNDLAKDSVGAAKIAKAAVSSAKLRGGAVTDGKIKDGAVVTDKIAAAAVTGPKLAPGSISVGKLSSPVVVAGAPVASGLGNPGVEFVNVAEVAAAATGAIATLPGVATYLGECAVGGANVSLVNEASNAQTVITDDGAGVVNAESVAGGATSTATTGTGDAHVTVFSHEPATGTSAHGEVLADHSAGGCTFYAWALFR